MGFIAILRPLISISPLTFQMETKPHFSVMFSPTLVGPVSINIPESALKQRITCIVLHDK